MYFLTLFLNAYNLIATETVLIVDINEKSNKICDELSLLIFFYSGAMWEILIFTINLNYTNLNLRILSFFIFNEYVILRIAPYYYASAWHIMTIIGCIGYYLMEK